MMTNTASLCQMLGGQRNRSFNVTQSHWKSAHHIFHAQLLHRLFSCCQSLQSHIDPTHLYGSGHEAHSLRFAPKHLHLILIVVHFAELDTTHGHSYLTFSWISVPATTTLRRSTVTAHRRFDGITTLYNVLIFLFLIILLEDRSSRGARDCGNHQAFWNTWWSIARAWGIQPLPLAFDGVRKILAFFLAGRCRTPEQSLAADGSMPRLQARTITDSGLDILWRNVSVSSTCFKPASLTHCLEDLFHPPLYCTDTVKVPILLSGWWVTRKINASTARVWHIKMDHNRHATSCLSPASKRGPHAAGTRSTHTWVPRLSPLFSVSFGCVWAGIRVVETPSPALPVSEWVHTSRAWCRHRVLRCHRKGGHCQHQTWLSRQGPGAVQRTCVPCHWIGMALQNFEVEVPRSMFCSWWSQAITTYVTTLYCTSKPSRSIVLQALSAEQVRHAVVAEACISTVHIPDDSFRAAVNHVLLALAAEQKELWEAMEDSFANVRCGLVLLANSHHAFLSSSPAVRVLWRIFVGFG